MRIVYNDHYLYFGFRFFDSEPEKVRATILNRGGWIHRDDKLEIAWTIAPIFVLAVVAIPTVSMIFEHDEIPTNKPKIEVTAEGYQWWWGFDYTDENINLTTANELHIPTDTVINLSLIHI